MFAVNEINFDIGNCCVMLNYQLNLILAITTAVEIDYTY